MVGKPPHNPPKTGLGTGLAARMALIDVERAVMEMRRGLPVIIEGPSGEAALAAAAELADAETLEFLETVTGSWPVLHLTHQRAETLKIRLQTEGGVTLALNKDEALAQITHLCNPARDLDFPLQGPFLASDEPLTLSQVASLQLAKLAGLLPATLSAPVAADAPADTFNLLHVSAASITTFERDMTQALAPAGHLKEQLVRVTDAKVPLADAPQANALQDRPESHIYAFRPHGTGGGGPEHLAIVIGTLDTGKPVLVRLHSECFTGDLLGSLKCDCGEQLRGAIAEISKAGSGILLYLAQEGRGIGLMNKLRAYQLQDQGFDTVDANLRLGFEVDERLFDSAAQMLRQLGVRDVRLMTNNPDKQEQLIKSGVTVSQRVPHIFASNQHNARYLATKAGKTGHIL